MEKKRLWDRINKYNLRIILFPVVSMVLVVGILIHNLFVLQIVDPEGYKTRAATQQMSITPIYAKRGNIYDTNGNKMAESAEAWIAILNPQNIKEEQRNLVVTNLAEILEMDPVEVMNKVYQTDSTYVRLKKQITAQQKQEIEEFTRAKTIAEDGILQSYIPGISFESDFKRYYMYGHTASTVLGFTGDGQTGRYGLELQYDDVLSGINGREVSNKNQQGDKMPFEYTTGTYAAQDGYSLNLTIDLTVQQTVDRLLEQAVIDNQVKNRGVCIVMDVNTGAIVALSVKPDFDPNEPSVVVDETTLNTIKQLPDSEQDEAYTEALYTQWQNKAVTDTYEPGSVFKIITASAALESGAFDLESQFYCDANGVEVVKDEDPVRCWKYKQGGHGWQDFTHALMHSCNPAFVKMALGMGSETFFDFFKAYGFTEKTGVDLPGEAVGLYYTDTEMGPMELATGSFGQTFTVTPMQMITAVSAAVNGGNLMLPYVVDSITDSDGNIIEKTEPTVRRQVISEEVSDEVCTMLEQVVSGDGGSGKNAYVEGYRIGGKTGTTQKTETRDELGETSFTISSFLGIAPADDPKYAVLLLLDEPYDANVFASTLAAPVVGEIFKDILPDLNVQPVYTDEELAKQQVATPTLIGKTVEAAEEEAEALGLDVDIQGEDGLVVRQTPSQGTMLSKGSVIVGYTETGPEEDLLAVVPDVYKMSPTAAESALIAAGLNPILAGGAADESAAIVTNQSYLAGEKIPMGTVVTVTCVLNEDLSVQ